MILGLFQRFIYFCNESPCNPLVFDMSVSVDEAATLLTKLLWGHLDLSRHINKFFQLTAHGSLSLNQLPM